MAEAMALTDVTALAPRILNTLSGGEKARVHLARALAQLWHPRPDGTSRWLLLDEPTAALDLAHQHSAMRLLRAWAARGVGVVAVLHDLNLAAAFAPRIVVLHQGRVVADGAPAEVLIPELVSSVFGVRVQVAYTEGGDRHLAVTEG